MKPVVLFVCQGNSVRSQMAEGILRKLAGDTFDVYSGGAMAKYVHPLTIQVMNEAGINITMHRSKTVMELSGLTDVTYFIAVDQQAQRLCPSGWPSMKARLLWPVDDPEQEPETLNQKVQLFRKCRDDLMGRIRNWMKMPGVME